MPELPEVETIVRELREEGLVGLAIIEAKVNWERSIAIPDKSQFERLIVNQVVKTINRRGKFIVIRFESGLYLLIHLRMTGQLVIEKGLAESDRHRQVELVLSDGRRLHFNDTRKFGRFFLVANPEEVLGNLGYEPLAPEFTVVVLAQGLQKSKRRLKPLLLEQRLVAGLGNIYVDEALFAAGLHPLRRADSLTEDEISRLHHAIREVLHQGIMNSGTSLGNGRGNYARTNRRRGRNQERLAVFRRTGQACLRCGSPIQRIKVGQRSTHFCPQCQQDN